MILARYIRIGALILCIYASVIGSAQTAMVHGRVVQGGGPVEFAGVVLCPLSDSLRPYKTALTDSTGNFSIAEVAYNEYVVRIQMLGYAPARKKLVVNSDAVDVNEITLVPDGKLLNAVEVVAQKDLIKKTPQGFIIQAKDNLTQAGGTVTDLLRNTPTIVVDADGNITIRGKSPLILINGRNSSLSSTDRIPASAVESIEIINNPTAQYDADAEGGIINIKLKKNTQKGTNGSVAAGAGYGAHPRGTIAFIINHSTGKWNIGLSYDNRFAERTRKAVAGRTSFFDTTNYLLQQNRHDNRLEQTHNARLNFDYNPNVKNSFSFEVLGNFQGEDNDETLVSEFDSRFNTFSTKNARRSLEYVREKVVEGAFTYNRKFDDPRRSLFVNLTSSFNFDRENTNITTQSLNADDSDLGLPFLQRTHDYQNSNVDNFRIDYIHPVGKNGQLETGYKAIARFTDADFANQYLVNNEYLLNAAVSNIFHFREQVHAAYLQYRGSSGKPDSAKWKYDIGLRAEQVYNHGYSEVNSVKFNRQYFNLFPTGNLAYYINAKDFLKVSFSRRINRPGLGQLNPFIDVTDSLNQHGGNPNLRPELVNAVEAGYNKEFKKISLVLNAFYRYSTNIIRPYISLMNNGVALTQPMNFGDATTYGAESILTVFPVKWWSVNVSVSLFQQMINGSNVSPDLSNNVLSWYGKAINNFSIWKGSRLQIITNYNSPVATPQGTRIAVYNVDMGFQQKFLHDKGALGIVITDVFNMQKSGLTANTTDFSYNRTFKVDTRAVMLTFAYTFGTRFKDELLENKFSND